MPTNRFQFSDDFVLNNGNVGINSATPQEKLDVVGSVRGDNLKVTGVSSFTTYEGFLNANQNIVENINLEAGQGITGSLSGEIIVGTGATVTGIASATSGQGYIESLKVYNTFTVPVGLTADRPTAPKPGQLYYNKDFASIEFYDGDRWRQVDNVRTGGRGVFGGGNASPVLSTSNIDFINISSQGNAISFGTLTAARRLTRGLSSSIRGIQVGGYQDAPVSVYSNIIDYITIASEGNSIDFGDLLQARGASATFSSSTRGIVAGGGTGSAVNTIDYITIATIGNALDFGDGAVVRENTDGCSSPTRGIFGGGAPSPSVPPTLASIEMITISSTGNGVNFGNLTTSRRQAMSCSSSTRGLWGGGETPSNVNMIDYVTISSTGNALNFGDLSFTHGNLGGSCSSQIRGIFTGGYLAPAGYRNNIDFVTIATTGNSQDFGDLSLGRGNGNGALSDSHGGLGGF